MATHTSEAVWTLLPNGYSDDGTKLKASILVSPRLMSDATTAVLGDYGPWRHWPATLAGMHFGVQVNGGATVPATAVSHTDQSVWDAIFRDGTPVTPFVFTDWSKKVVLSYPVADLAAVIDAAYSAWAVSTKGDLLDRQQLKSRFARMGHRLDPADVLRKIADGQDYGRNLGLGPDGPKNPQELGATLDLLTAYHRPLNAQSVVEWTPPAGDTVHEKTHVRQGARPPLPKPADLAKRVDFHQIAASLGQYADLARLCGFIVDVEIPAAGIPAAADLQVVPKFAASGAPGVRAPVSKVSKTPKTFLLQPAPAAPGAVSPYVDRWLRLDASGPFQLVQMDVDGAGLKFSQFAESMMRDVPADFDDEGATGQDPNANQEPIQTEAGAPSLRTGGLTLAMDRRHAALSAAFKRAKQLNTDTAGGAAAPMWAEDAVRGYRVDVLDETTGAWRSLCARYGTYTFRTGGHADLKFGVAVAPGAAGGKPSDEGMVRAAAGSSTDGANANLVKVHEGLFNWRGWSLCAPEPGKWVDKDNNFQSEQGALPNDLPLNVSFEAQPGTLPSLRFGRRYKVRVRLVDLAGNSAPPSATDHPAAAETPATPFLRYEPVEPPTLALVGSGPGDLEVPGDGESMGRLAVRSMDAAPPSPPRARRQVVPPRVGARFAELHGVLDGPDGKLDPSRFPQLLAQDSPLKDFPVTTPLYPSGSQVQPWPAAPVNFPLPFLPDPMAFGVAIRILGVPGLDPDKVWRVPLYDPGKNVWPKAFPFLLELKQGAPSAGFTIAGDGTRTFSVTLGPADRAKLRISSILPAKSLKMMKWVDRIATAPLSPADAHLLAGLVEGGRHWMLTPWRTVELVHAVQRPLVKPEIQNLARAQRGFGELDASLPFSTPLDGRSTGRIDLYGEWNEVADDPAEDRPKPRRAKADAWHMTVRRGDTGPTLSVAFRRAPPQHKFADTRYRRVSYRLDATTRHREYMPPSVREHPDRLMVSSALHQVWVPNSAPPPPPAVLYVVPTFGWSRAQTGDEHRSWRFGGGLRVYLDRPWFASGYGELLGVMLPPENATPDQLDGPLKTLVTRWGRDPLWPQKPIKRPAPAKSAFPLARYQAPIAFDGLPDLPADEGTALPADPFPQGLSHPDLPDSSNLRLDVAPHAVGWDDERKLYYADIVVNLPAGAYLPFVRLALARYHPVSVEGAHLSHVVLTEFQQLTPDRLAVVTLQPVGRVISTPPVQTAKVAVFGVLPPDLPASQGLPTAGKIDIRVQTLAPGANPDLDWVDWSPPAGARSPAFNPALGGAGLGPNGGRITPPSPDPVRAQVQAPVASPATEAARLRADQLIAQGRFADIVRDTGLMAVLQPPKIDEDEVMVPMPQPGVRRRLVITESETYLTRLDTSGETGQRIVYAETVEL